MSNSVSADVVIAGAGNAALVAALAAHDQGAQVIVLEAADVDERGGNSRFSGGLFRCAHGGLADLLPLVNDESRQWSDRVTVDAYSGERFHDDLMATSDDRADLDLIERLVGESYDTVQWMKDRGVRWELSVGKLIDPDKIGPENPYALPAGGALRAEGEGVGLVQNLFDAVEAAPGIEVRYGHPVSRLLTRGSTVTGVRVQLADHDLDVYGTVVLAAGGFEANPAMRQRYLGWGWDLVKVRGSRFNMGTVLSEALDAGAAPAGHYGGCHASPLDASAPAVGDLRLTDKMSRYSYPYAALVNVDGERFIDEGEDEVWLTYAKTGAAIRAQKHARAVQIFDQKTVHLLEPRYSTGTPVVADTLAELAGRIGVNPDKLQETIDGFNAACPPGDFDPFSKDGLRATPAGQPVKSNWSQPIDKPPYVAYAVTCGITFTYGGVRIDRDARVLDTTGQDMPGLYATGEIAGGFFYHNYPAGSGLMRGAVFGRIAGTNAGQRAVSRRESAGA